MFSRFLVTDAASPIYCRAKVIEESVLARLDEDERKTVKRKDYYPASPKLP